MKNNAVKYKINNEIILIKNNFNFYNKLYLNLIIILYNL